VCIIFFNEQASSKENYRLTPCSVLFCFSARSIYACPYRYTKVNPIISVDFLSHPSESGVLYKLIALPLQTESSLSVRPTVRIHAITAETERRLRCCVEAHSTQWFTLKSQWEKLFTWLIYFTRQPIWPCPHAEQPLTLKSWWHDSVINRTIKQTM